MSDQWMTKTGFCVFQQYSYGQKHTMKLDKVKIKEVYVRRSKQYMNDQNRILCLRMVFMWSMGRLQKTLNFISISGKKLLFTFAKKNVISLRKKFRGYVLVVRSTTKEIKALFFCPSKTMVIGPMLRTTKKQLQNFFL